MEIDPELQKTITLYCERFDITETLFFEKAAVFLIGLTLHHSDALEIIERTQQLIRDGEYGN